MKIHPQVRGTAYVVLFTLSAWLVASFGPIISFVRLMRGLYAHVIYTLKEVGYNIAGNIIPSISQIIELIYRMISDPSNVEEFIVSEILGVDVIASDIFNLGDYLIDVSWTVARGLFPFIFGLTLQSLIFIPFIIMLVILKKNVRAGKVLLIVNACICIAGNLICFSVIKNIYDAMGTVQPPYHNITFITLMLVFTGALLWIAGIIFYLRLAKKSEQLTNSYISGPAMSGVISPVTPVSSKRFCENCGVEAGTGKFCSNCGAERV